MSRVGQGPQAGYLTPNINKPDSFTVSGPINTEGLAVFKITAEPNVTTLPSSANTVVLADQGYLQEYDFSNTANGAPIGGQQILHFGTTSVNTQYGRLAHQVGGVTTGWGNMTQSDISRQDNPAGYKMNFGPTEGYFVREGCITFNNVANIGQMYVTGTGAATTQWQQINGNIFQVGYGLGNGSGAQGKRVYAEFSQETKYPLDFLKSEQRWFAFSTRRLSYEAEYCMEVYREGDITDVAQIGWNNNGLINISELTAHAAKGGVPANVRVKTWYNQSGNGYHATVPDLASNPTRGPLIMESTGAYRKIGGNNVPALDFDAAQFMRANTGGSGDVDQPLWATVVGAFDDIVAQDYFFDGDDTDRTLFFGDGNTLRWGAGSYPTIGGARNTNDHLWIMMFNGANSFFRQDGTTLTANTTDVGTGDNDGLTIGARYTDSSILNGKLSEIVMFQGNTSMAFTDAWISRYETQTNNYYDIY